MANEGLNKMRFRAGDIPTIDSSASSNSYKPAIRGEGARIDIPASDLELSNSCSRAGIVNCDSFIMV